jgi:hypothetical protein
MNNIELRKKYGDHPENPIYAYPDHYFANKDGFTMHITNWLTFLSKFENTSNTSFFEFLENKILHCQIEYSEQDHRFANIDSVIKSLRLNGVS